jgi:DNA-binding HxlR family transcriptional regulator
MYKYGQYCPIARASEILGDRWTLLIVRDLLLGKRHFNDLERGLPGISRGLLAERLHRLQKMGVIERHPTGRGRKTEYYLTKAGEELQPIVDVLTVWGARWAFGEPEEEELDPVLLMWWMRDRVYVDQLPRERIVVQFDFRGAKKETFWLILAVEDVSVCLTHPGFEVDVLVTADLSTFYQVWLGRISYAEALRERKVEVEGIPAFVRNFSYWFAWSPVATTVRAETSKNIFSTPLSK